eukprot:Skav232158  [mRNA]  locus=scaffold1040:482222:483243:- [translate_table: standard]
MDIPLPQSSQPSKLLREEEDSEETSDLYDLFFDDEDRFFDVCGVNLGLDMGKDTVNLSYSGQLCIETQVVQLLLRAKADKETD